MGIFAVERNKDAFSTLKYNLIKRKKHFSWPNWLEMKNWDINELLEVHSKELAALNGSVDLVVGGPPCQGFFHGRQEKKWWYQKSINAFVYWVYQISSTDYVIFWNVQGFTVGFKDHKDKQKYSDILVSELHELGYNLDYKIVTMSEYGCSSK